MANPAKFQVVSQRDAVGLFFQIYEAKLEDSWVPLLSNTFTSNQTVETYAGIGNAPAMREWVGGRLAKSLAEYSRTVANKDYEATLEIFRKDLKRDKSGQLAMKIAGMAERAAEHDEKMISALIDAGLAGSLDLAYDGQFFFDTDHSVGLSGTMDNDITVDISALATGDTTGTHGVVTAPSVGEAALSVLAGIQALYGFKDDQGEPTNQSGKKFIVMVPTSLWGPFSGITTVGNLAGGFNNPLQAAASSSGVSIQVVANPRLTWTDEFAVFRIDSMLKPYILQVEETPVMEVIGEGSEYAFDHAAHKYGIRKSGAVASWDFTKAVLVTMT